MIYVIYLGLFLPLLSFISLMTFSSLLSRKTASMIACSTVLISFICFACLLYDHSQNNFDNIYTTLFTWISVDKINADFALHLDSLSLLMTLIITGVGFLIHVYSIGYMEYEEDYTRYFACMNFFIFAMLLLVLAENLLLLFVGWEGVGLASYLLIGFYYTRKAAAQAATKAFVMNRIGDFGFLVGLLLTFHLFGTSSISEINQRAPIEYSIGAPVILLLTFLFFVGAIGKSAQLPLYTWLPDAMEGPTPVSALIHAATMVTAGIYLIVRLHPVYILAPTTLHIIAGVGAITSLFAALCAMGQSDLKRVLAFSTVSQLGLMFLACGIGAFYAGMFHLTTHAFIKALLFLSAGIVVHMLHGKTDMQQMGGLHKRFPKTHWLFLIGVLALSGIPPMAAFFSKDLILEEDYLAGFTTLFYIALAASILTGFYMTRAYCLTFLGAPHEDIDKSSKEAPHVMFVPVALLALFSIIGGFIGFAFGKTPALEGFLGEVGVTTGEPPLGLDFLYSPETLLSIFGAIVGVGSAAILYTKYRDQLGYSFPILRKGFFVNELYTILFVNPLEKLARFIDYVLEPKFFNGLIWKTVHFAQSSAGLLQKQQSGQIRSYVAWFVLGTAALLAFFVLKNG
jgi:NADH-quinone oxidoreductase subunit L